MICLDSTLPQKTGYEPSGDLYWDLYYLIYLRNTHYLFIMGFELIYNKLLSKKKHNKYWASNLFLIIYTLRFCLCLPHLTVWKKCCTYLNISSIWILKEHDFTFFYPLYGISKWPEQSRAKQVSPTSHLTTRCWLLNFRISYQNPSLLICKMDLPGSVHSTLMRISRKFMIVLTAVDSFSC
jgi:hypothetical protein